MLQLLIAAPASGGGKTTAACALLRALKRRGLRPCAFKCGPDYIDPMFHRGALGVPSRNLDLFLGGGEVCRAVYARGCAGADCAVIEGAMGFYDGLGGVTDRASAWRTAGVLGVPVLLSLPARGAGLSLAAVLRGLRDFRAESRIAAVLLSRCGPGLARTLAPALEAEAGIPVLGCLPELDAARFGSRHLGLLAPEELRDLDRRLDLLAEAWEANVDMERLAALFDRPPLSAPGPPAGADAPKAGKRARIAVARDEAFSFCYAETIETLEAQGAEVVYFSPLRDAALPAGAGGLYLPGGYPELHARALSENLAMRRAVAEAVRGGLPTVAECGGFLYLCTTLRDPDGGAWPMAGVLPGEAADAGRLVRFGYAELRAEDDSLLFRAGERVPVHEFHRWEAAESGSAFAFEKPVSLRRWRGGFAGPSLYAGFAHLYFAGRPELARRFAAAARGD